MIVALDIATQTGVAVGSPGGAPRAWSVDLGKGSSDDARFSAVLTLTHKLIAEYKPRLLAIEAPVGGPKASHLLIGLVACVKGCAANRSIPVKDFPINSVRKHFLGRAPRVSDYPAKNRAAAVKAMKADVMARCRLLGWQVDGHDEADAVALWDFACATLGAQTTPAGGLFR